MVVTGSCSRMSASESGCAEGQKMDERTKSHKILQTSCHLHGRFPVENGIVGQTVGENRNLSEVYNEATTDNEIVNNHIMATPVYENACGNSQRLEGHYFGTKGDMVFSLLSVLGTHNKEDMSRTLLAMSTSFESCVAMRQSGCLPLLIHLLHGGENDASNVVMRSQAAAALHNIVHVHCEDQRGRQEARVLRLLEQIRGYCDYLRLPGNHQAIDHLANSQYSGPSEYYPGPAVAALMKLSFDEEHRHAVCTLGGVQAIAELLQMDHETTGNTTNQYHITMRRYACMALTNLTFGDGTNKALLCSMVPALKALVQQLESSNEDLCQVAASVLRNLSWHADFTSKRILRDVGAVPRLTRASLVAKKESTLKSLLSALWNFSSHCIENKADICVTEGALQFLIKNLTYRSPLKTLSIIENCGGILRNISSHIAVREDYRAILRQHGCLQILLKHLRSPSLTVVSNACGTLWNLSARCAEDQKILLELGALNMLKNLVHSKHKMISMGSAAALKNLLSAMPNLQNGISIEPALSLSASKSDMPGLHMRRQRALESELEQQNLSETCDNMESPQVSPTESPKLEMHAKPKQNSSVVALSGSSTSRMMSSFRGQLPADGVNALCHHGNQGNSSSLHASFEEITDKKRVHEILYRSNRLLQDRQSSYVPDPVAAVATGAKDVTRTVGYGLDAMSGSHSQFQDVKMMHSFSSYCEPTALTSPETSPTPEKQMMNRSARRYFRPHEMLQLTNISEERAGLPKTSPEEVVQPSDAPFFLEPAESEVNFDSGSTDDTKSSQAVADKFEFEADLPYSTNAFSMNRLSIACSENVFSFSRENSPVPFTAVDDDNFLRKAASVDAANHNIITEKRDCLELEKEVNASGCCAVIDGGHVFDFEDIQSRINKQLPVDSKTRNFEDIEPLFSQEEDNEEKSLMGCVVGKSETVKALDCTPIIVPGLDSTFKYNKNEEFQIPPENGYAEKFMKCSSSSREDETPDVSADHLSPSHSDTLELMVLNPDFRRLSSSGSQDDEIQDDEELLPDSDAVIEQELPGTLSDSEVVEDDLAQETTADINGLSSESRELSEGLWRKRDCEQFPSLDGSSVDGDRTKNMQNSIIKGETSDAVIFPAMSQMDHILLEQNSWKGDTNALDLVTESFCDTRREEVFQRNDNIEDISLVHDATSYAPCPVVQEINKPDHNGTKDEAFLRKSLSSEFNKTKYQHGINSFEEDNDFVVVNVCCELSDTEMMQGDMMMLAAKPDIFCSAEMSRVALVDHSRSESVTDIMNESFPDISSSLISDLTSSHEDVLSSESFKPNKSSSLPYERSNFEVFEVPHDFCAGLMGGNKARGTTEAEEIFKLADEASDLECSEISMEQERALEENANLILSELERTTMLESGVSEAHFLEYETLSLVSNDEGLSDDDMSEASCSLSVTSVTHSEPASDRCSNSSHISTAPLVPPSGPRIVKPVVQESVNQNQHNKDAGNGPKAIRGRRKLLYNNGKSKQPAQESNPSKLTAIRPVLSAKKLSEMTPQNKSVNRLTSAKPVNRPLVAKTLEPKSKNQPVNSYTIQSSKQPSVSSNRSLTPSTVAKAKPRAPSLPNERRLPSYNRQTKSAPVRSKPAVIPAVRAKGLKDTGKQMLLETSDNAKHSISVIERSHLIEGSSAESIICSTEVDEGLDRPKPPIKQDTFVKETPSFSVVVVNNKEEGEELTWKRKEKESDQVSRSSVESFGRPTSGASSLSSRGSTLASRAVKPRQRQANSDTVLGKKIPVSESQASKARASYAVGLGSKGVSKVGRGSSENSIKTSSFIKRPTAASNAAQAGSNCSVSSVGKISQNVLSRTNEARSLVSGERLSNASSQVPKTAANSVKELQNSTSKKTAVVAERPTFGKVKKYENVQQTGSTRSNTRPQVQQPNKQPITGNAPAICTLTRSSTYDKLIEDDHYQNDDDQESVELSLRDLDTKSKDDKELEAKPLEVDPRRLTRVVESTLKFGHSLPNDDEDEIAKTESVWTPKSQERADLTLELDSEVRITDALYSGRSLTLDRSSMMNNCLFDRLEEQKSAGDLLENQNQSSHRLPKTSSTLPRSLFSPSRVSSRSREHLTQAGENAGENAKSNQKAVRNKEGRKLGFGLWKRNNTISKGKAEEEESVMQPSDAKAGSPVHKVFGWFRRGGNDGSKKSSASKIPGPELNESSHLDNSKVKMADVNSNQMRKSDLSKRGIAFSTERQVGLSATRGSSPLRAAIVQPFNYRPAGRGGVVASEIRNESPSEPMTKTEMLLARRRQSRAVSGSRDSANGEEGFKQAPSDPSKKLPEVPNSKDPKSAFLVTSV